MSKWIEKFWMNIAWCLPNRLVHWCAIRIGVNATTGKYSQQIVSELNFMTALKRWEVKNEQA